MVYLVQEIHVCEFVNTALKGKKAFRRFPHVAGEWSRVGNS